LTMQKSIRASGKISLHRAVSDSTSLFGFYDSVESMMVSADQSSMLPRSFMGVAVEGPSREGFFLQPAFRSGGVGSANALGPQELHIYPDGTSHSWALEYSPDRELKSVDLT